MAGALIERRSLDDLDAPLWQVTFVVVDVETTGGAPDRNGITEVGAVKLRGGECLGTLSTLVNPGDAIPPEITYLTGITEAMVVPAPSIDAVLPSFLEFVGDAVLVGHNVAFDVRFLDAALRRSGRPRLANRIVDTCALARRLVRDEVPNCKLATLADHFRTATRPTHRALTDALATGELLHHLLERAGTLGVVALDDLLALPTVAGHPQAAKLELVSSLPRSPGVYLFRDHGGRVLYVGKATNLRRRVRSYFSHDDRRKIGPLLRELATVDHIVCRGDLEASVLELRLIRELSPRYNRRGRTWRQYAYLKVTLDERFPRLAVVRRVRSGDGCVYIGPLSSSRVAQLAVEAIQTAVPIRRCTRRIGATLVAGPCAPAQLGVSTCPCSGDVSDAEYQAIVSRLIHALREDPRALLHPLRHRMHRLAAARRYEEAAATRDRADALARALARQRRLEALRSAGRLVVEAPGEGRALIEGGRLVDVSGVSADRLPGSVQTRADGCNVDNCNADGSSARGTSGDATPEVPAEHEPIGADVVDELACVAQWLHTRAGEIRLVAVDHGLASPLPALPSFRAPPARAGPTR